MLSYILFVNLFKTQGFKIKLSRKNNVTSVQQNEFQHPVEMLHFIFQTKRKGNNLEKLKRSVEINVSCVLCNYSSFRLKQLSAQN